QQPAIDQPGEFLSWLVQQDAARSYELIVPATESSLLMFRTLDAADPLRTKAVLPDNAALDVALDKQKTWSLANELNVPVPHSRLISSLDEIGCAGQFPLVLKPVRSKVMVEGELRTLAVAIVRDESHRQSQLRDWLRYTPVMQQQYVFGRGIGAEFLFDRGRKVWHFVHERIHEFPLSGGASSYRRSIEPPPTLLADAEKLLTALRWHGVAMVEFKMDPDGRHWLMEINPRFWGSLALAIDAGINFPLGLLSVARGQQLPAQPRYRTLYYARDLRTDADWFRANLRADHHDPLLMVRPRLLSFFEVLRPLVRKESWDHFDWRDLRVTRRILTLTVADQLRPLRTRLAGMQLKHELIRHHRDVLEKLRTGKIRKIVFLCLGNICRSPLAARLAAQRLPGLEITSAGFFPREGRTSPEKMVRIAADYGVNLRDHRSARVTREMLVDADLILVMDQENMTLLKHEYPEASSRTTLLGLFASPRSINIRDPYQEDEAATRTICDRIRAAVDGLASQLMTARAKAESSTRQVSAALP
ncbi:MAG TPA: ATP-grasp domain-containing protein, partial [Candidatus Limnocylindrales bacterium]|nr:ATP-grasp domain-containing protein [Candidatus Limnocylindrales bacterium]